MRGCNNHYREEGRSMMRMMRSHGDIGYLCAQLDGCELDERVSGVLLKINIIES